MKSNRLAFGKEAMRRWWHEKDFIGFISETRFDASVTLDEALERVRHVSALGRLLFRKNALHCFITLEIAHIVAPSGHHPRMHRRLRA